MKPIKPLEEELQEYLGDWGFPAFESTENGHIRLDDNPKRYVYDFYMRVGLHMKRPTQVIMSCGKYLKMRKAEKWASFPLRDIDPGNPETTLYEETDWSSANLQLQAYQAQIYQGGNLGLVPAPTLPKPKRTWRPVMPSYGNSYGTAVASGPLTIPNGGYTTTYVGYGQLMGNMPTVWTTNAITSNQLSGLAKLPQAGSNLGLGLQPLLPRVK